MTVVCTYIGTRTDGDSEGIYRCLMDEEAGTIDNIELAAQTENPTFLATSPNNEFLYATNEADQGRVTAFAIEADGALRQLNHQVVGPANPCHCSIDRTGQYLLVAHYIGGAVSILPIKDDGTLGKPTITEHEGSSVHPERQTGPHPHMIIPGPDNAFAYVTDLGTDTVVVYDLDLEAGMLHRSSTVQITAGAGPRHLEFSPDGRYAYLINELNSTLSMFERDQQSGSLKQIGTANTLEAEYDGENYPADVHLHPTEDYVYGSNRGHDSIAIFDTTDDTLELVGTQSTHGEWPWNFTISANGEFLFVANAYSNTIVPLTINQETGRLDATGDQVDIPHPVCLTVADEL